LSNHTNYANGVAFSFDHSYLASCSQDGYLNIWNPSTDWSLSYHLYNGACNALAQLPNNQLAASSISNINIWSPTAQIKTLTGHTAVVSCLALSPNGSLLASGAYDNTTKVWNYTSQTTALMTFRHTNWVRAVCFVSDQILASGSVDFTIYIWDINSGKFK
jgi:WD40 repeat protein